jgi:hypothetical protein
MLVSKKSLENLKKGKKFSSDYQPEIRGKRRNRLRAFIEEERFSLDDLRAILEGLLTSYSFEEIENMYNTGREDLPALITMFLKAFIVDIKKGSLSSVEIILDRVHGKATQSTSIEVHDVPEEAKKRMAAIFESSRKESAKIKPKNIAQKKEPSLDDDEV